MPSQMQRQLTLEEAFSRASARNRLSAIGLKVCANLNQAISCYLEAKAFLSFYIALRSLHLNIMIPKSLLCTFVENIAKKRKVELTLAESISNFIDLRTMQKICNAISCMYNCSKCNQAPGHKGPHWVQELSDRIKILPQLFASADSDENSHVPIQFSNYSVNPNVPATISVKSSSAHASTNFIETVGTATKCKNGGCRWEYCKSKSCVVDNDDIFAMCCDCKSTVCGACMEEDPDPEVDISYCNSCDKSRCAVCTDNMHCESCYFTSCLTCSVNSMTQCSFCHSLFCINRCSGRVNNCNFCNRSMCTHCLGNDDVILTSCSKCEQWCCSDCGLIYCELCNSDFCNKENCESSGIIMCDCGVCGSEACPNCITSCLQCREVICDVCSPNHYGNLMKPNTPE